VGTPLALLSTASISISLALRSLPSEEKIKAFSQTSSCLLSLSLTHTHKRTEKEEKGKRVWKKRSQLLSRGDTEAGTIWKIKCFMFEI
jgi:hypothetical protein